MAAIKLAAHIVQNAEKEYELNDTYVLYGYTKTHGYLPVGIKQAERLNVPFYFGHPCGRKHNVRKTDNSACPICAEIDGKENVISRERLLASYDDQRKQVFSPERRAKLSAARTAYWARMKAIDEPSE